MRTSRTSGAGPTILPHVFDLGQAPHPIVFWDTSRGPAWNDREAKLGHMGGTRGAIGALFDQDTLDRSLVDGYHGTREISSIMVLEPDNWNFRAHTKDGQGLDNVVAVRNVVDHSNPAAGRKNRSTHWIDQEPLQEWAISDDLFRIVQKDTPVDDPELYYTMAGFLEIFSGAKDPKGRPGGPELPIVPGKSTRGALALELSRNLGFICDSGSFGQLSHALVFLKPSKAAAPSVPTPGSSSPPGVASVDPRFGPRPQPRAGEPGGPNNFRVINGQLTVNGAPIQSQQPPQDPGPAEPAEQEDGARPKTENELGLRLDVGFLCDAAGKKVARLTDEQPPSAADQGEGDIKLVTLFVSEEEASPDDKLDTLEDANSNHEKLPKPVKKHPIRGWVKIPKPGSCEPHHYDYSYHHPPPGSSSSSSGGWW
jgi:hypothetical protein